MTLCGINYKKLQQRRRIRKTCMRIVCEAEEEKLVFAFVPLQMDENAERQPYTRYSRCSKLHRLMYYNVPLYIYSQLEEFISLFLLRFYYGTHKNRAHCTNMVMRRAWAHEWNFFFFVFNLTNCFYCISRADFCVINCKGWKLFKFQEIFR